MPTVLPSILSFPRGSLLFAKVETTPFTEIKPGTTDQILLAGEMSVGQELGLIDDPQRRNTFSPLAQIVGRYEPGSLSIPMLIKPRAAGTAPDGGVLLKHLFGRETIVGGTSVKYHPLRISDTRTTLTVWCKAGHFVHRCIGTVLTEGRFPCRAGNSGDALGQCTLTGVFAEHRWTGTDEFNATCATAATTFTAKNAKKFTVGSYVKFKTVAGTVDDNSGAGYQITAINYGTNVCTFTPGLAGAGMAADDLIEPWIPTGSENGTIVHGRLGTVTRGGSAVAIMDGEITYRFPANMLSEEKNGSAYATRFSSPEARSVECRLNAFFDANSAAFFYDAQQGTQGDVVMNWGDTAGARFKLTLKNQRLKAPAISGDKERMVALTGMGAASASYDDELELLLD